MTRPYATTSTEMLQAALNEPSIGEPTKAPMREELARRSEAGGGPDTADKGRGDGPEGGTAPRNPSSVSLTPQVSVKAPGSTKVGVMNKTEAAYARRLDADPEVREWWYESVKVRCGVERAWLTPDFFVHYADGGVGFDEVKGGYTREDSLAKFKAAAALHPWARWRMFRLVDGEWELVYDYPREVAA